MKTVLFLCGANGVGKTTVCQYMVEHTPHTAYVDSDACRLMNPFVLDDVTIPVIADNISSLIRHYLQCEYVETVLFSYGFHGRRKEVFSRVMESLNGLSFEFIPVMLVCEETENVRRMRSDGRDEERILRAIAVSRNAFEGVDYPVLDVTEMSVEQTAAAVLRMTAKQPESR